MQERPVDFPARGADSVFKLQQMTEQEEGIDTGYQEQCPDDFLFFARGLKIASQTGPKVFERVIQVFQRRAFEDMAPSIQQLRDGTMPKCRRWWIERTKKAGKDSDLALVVLWLLAFPTRPFYIQIAAADKNQAKIVKERMSHLLHWNPWLNDHIEMINWEVRSKKLKRDGQPLAKLDIMSSDIAGAHGGTPDLLIMNELSHVVKWEFVENLMDNADGVAMGMVIIATNAGFKGTKAEVWRKTAMLGDNWGVHVLDSPAPWHSKETIQEAKRRNTRTRYKRLWYGHWASGKGDALDEEAITACFSLGGPTLKPESGWRYIAGVDLGITHDHSGVVFIGVHEREQRVRLMAMQAWEPAESTGEVDLQAVEDYILAMTRLFRPAAVYFDPTEARLMMQQLRKKGVPAREFSFSNTTNLNRMAECIISLVENRRLELYDDLDGRLRRDFGKFNIVEKAYGYKLEAVRDEFGHADVGTALAICCPAITDILAGLGLGPDDDLLCEGADGDDLTEDEVDAMPDELRAIYEMDEELEYTDGRDW